MTLTKADFDALIKSLDDATTAAGVRIQTLVDKLKAGGMTADEEQAVFDAIGAETARLVEFAKDPANPVPNPVPTPVPGEEPPAPGDTGGGEQP